MFKKKHTIIFAILALFALTAFGCKKEEPEPANQPVVQPNITINEENTALPDTNAEFPIINANEMANETNESGDLNEEIEKMANEMEKEDVANQIENIEEKEVEEIEKTEEATVLALAEKIAEIYGTYTNKDKEAYKNYKTLKTYATDKMKKWLDIQIDQPLDKDAPFYGVTTKTISAAITNSKDNKMTAIVTAKREEITANSNRPDIKYEILELKFVKEKTEWKLSGAYWLK